MRHPRRPRTQSAGAVIHEIPLAQIRESDHLRLRQPPYPNIEELAEQIRVRGQTTPMFVKEWEHSLYILISGYRRKAALELLGASTALVRIFELDDEAAYDLAISENQHRDALSEIERADIAKKLQSTGKTQPEIATRMGWANDRTVRRYIQLAEEATPPLRDVLQNRALSFRAAMVFVAHGVDLPEKRQREILAHAVSADIPAAKLERLLLRAKGKKNAPRPSPEPMKQLKDGGFVLRTTRFDADDPTGVQDAITILKSALQKARRLQKAQAKKRPASGASEVPS